ncbi:MAG: ketopantoate reductase family protein [Chloroflexota bacterium]
MRSVIVGIGGIGGYLGGRLASRFPPGSEHEIVFLEKDPSHLHAIKRNGLKLLAKDGDVEVRPAMATDAPGELGRVDLVLLCVKGYDLAAAARELTPVVDHRTVVIPPGNGVGNTEIVRKGLGRGDVLSACIYISTHVQAPGIVEQVAGPRKFYFGNPNGETEPYRRIESLFLEAGLNVELSAHILREVWSKYLFVEPLSALTSLYEVPQGGLLDNEEKKAQVRRMMEEIGALAVKAGVDLPDDIVDQSMSKAESFPYETWTSMQLDFQHGRPTELETMVGYAVRKAQELDVPMPQHGKVYEQLLKKTK